MYELFVLVNICIAIDSNFYLDILLPIYFIHVQFKLFKYRPLTLVYIQDSPQLHSSLYTILPCNGKTLSLYLGVTLDRKIKFDAHINTVANTAKIHLAKLNDMISRWSRMSLKIRITFTKCQ